MIPQDYHKKIELFSDQLDNHLLPGVEENLQKHLKDCRECQKIFREMENIQMLLTRFKPEEPPEDFEDEILKTAKEKIARNPFLRRRVRYISCVLGSVILILLLFMVFYLKPPSQSRPVARSVTTPKNRMTPVRETVLAEKAMLLEKKSFRSAPPPHIVIRNEKEWANIWRFQNAGRNVSALLPEVDFNTKMVVVIISQDDKSEYTITKTEENKDEVIITCEETSLTYLTHKNPPLPLYQFQFVAAKSNVTFRMITKKQ